MSYFVFEDYGKLILSFVTKEVVPFSARTISPFSNTIWKGKLKLLVDEMTLIGIEAKNCIIESWMCSVSSLTLCCFLIVCAMEINASDQYLLKLQYCDN